MKLGVLVVLAAMLMLAAGQASAANLVGNPGFEVGGGWPNWWVSDTWDTFSVIPDDPANGFVGGYFYTTAAQGPAGLPRDNGYPMIEWSGSGDWTPSPTENRAEYNMTTMADYSQGYANPIYTGYKWCKKNPSPSSASFYSGIAQLITGLVPGQTYELAGWGTSSAPDAASAADIRLLVNPDAADIYADEAPISSAAVPNHPWGQYWLWGRNAIGTWDDTSAADVTGFYQIYDRISVQFTAPSSGSVRIFVLMDWRNFDSNVDNQVGIGFDNVTLTAVPEPSSLVALGAPVLLAGLGFIRRRRS